MIPEDRYMDDEFMASFRLSPEDVHFKAKGNLKKDINDLTESQIEYLSIASLENDITPEQQDELLRNLEQNEQSRRIFSLVSKTKLTPPVAVFSRKNALRKATTGQRIFRIAVTGLSAAATVAILVTSYIFIAGKSGKIPDEQLATISIIPLTIAKDYPIVIIPQKSVTNKLIIPERSAPAEIVAVPETRVPEASIAKARDAAEVLVAAVIVPSASGIEFQSPGLSLLASNTVFRPETEDDRSRVRKFIATTFRQKILGEKEFTDVPLKPYEIALAGIDGLNKLLDWDMQLRETRDESGEVRSVSFSSALLSFNTPVK